jgi:hypothetical protein
MRVHPRLCRGIVTPFRSVASCDQALFRAFVFPAQFPHNSFSSLSCSPAAARDGVSPTTARSACSRRPEPTMVYSPVIDGRECPACAIASKAVAPSSCDTVIVPTAKGVPAESLKIKPQPFYGGPDYGGPDYVADDRPVIHRFAHLLKHETVGIRGFVRTC